MTDRGISPVPREARAYQGQPAGVVSRLAAGAVDGAVVALFLLGGYLALVALRFMLDPRSFRFPNMSLAFNLTAGFVVAVCYLTVAWWIGGRSYGKLLMGLRVLARDGGRLRLAPALFRAVLCVLFPIGLMWCALSPVNRSLQDVLMRTSVVYDW
jgi:uncharacterized RDD family membrane protein YckC